MNYIEQLGKAAKASKKSIATAGTAKKNELLEKIAENLRKNIKLDKELNKIFHSEWLKSILLDSIFTTTGISFDISAELKSTILN